jgi:DNA-binding PucR family transcriptional regulator
MSGAQDREAAPAASRSLREADLLRELGPLVDGHEQTYRLLIGVLCSDPPELQRLRSQTVSPLMAYDSEHGTELVTTLREFLLNDGSTTETAERMRLHRHTVGYRLARVHEVSGLSPYESDGRELLGLGLKADQILAASERLSKLE